MSNSFFNNDLTPNYFLNQTIDSSQAATDNTVIVAYEGTATDNTSIVAYECRPTNAVEKIMSLVVADNSSICYRNNNIIFILWIYNNEERREELLHDWMVVQLIQAEAEDHQTPRTQKSRPNARAVCKAALESINKVDKNCPIVLSKISFNLFSHYVTTRKTSKGDYLSKAGYGLIRSALKHLYRMSGEKMGPKFENELSQFMSGLKRTVAKVKADSGRSLDEGKKGMKFDVYKKLCEIMFCKDNDDFLFAHTFLTLAWNLLARADNCFIMKVQHIEFQHDSMMFYFGKTKVNHTGDGSE